MAVPVGMHRHVESMAVAQVTFDPAALGTGPSVAEQTFTLPGAQVGDLVFVTKPTLTAAMAVLGARVSAANTVAVTLLATAGTPNAGAEVYDVLWIRVPKKVTSVNGL